MEVPDLFLRRFSATICVHLSPGRLVARSIPEGLRIDTDDAGCGIDASIVQAGFGHPRVLAADRKACETVLNAMIRGLCGRRSFVKPAVVVHLDEIWRDQVTEGEILYLFDVLEQSGSRVSWLWLGRELIDEELQARKFPADGLLWELENGKLKGPGSG